MFFVVISVSFVGVINIIFKNIGQIANFDMQEIFNICTKETRSTLYSRFHIRRSQTVILKNLISVGLNYL